MNLLIKNKGKYFFFLHNSGFYEIKHENDLKVLRPIMRKGVSVIKLRDHTSATVEAFLKKNNLLGKPQKSLLKKLGDHLDQDPHPLMEQPWDDGLISAAPSNISFSDYSQLQAHRATLSSNS